MGLGLLVLLAACRTPGSRDGEDRVGARASDPDEHVVLVEAVALALRPVDDWPRRQMLRQRVRIEWSQGEEGFDAVLQKRPGELALIGLGPMNLVGFRLALVAKQGVGGPTDRIDFENRSGRELPFSPAHMLADVQRVFYPWIEAEAGCGDCERSGRRGGLEVWEREESGVLAERRFGLVGFPEEGLVRIRYADWRGDPAVPRSVEVDNAWFGYRLRIETLETTALELRPSPR